MELKISKKEILKYASNADVYRRGYKYYQEGRATAIDYANEEREIIATATVDGNYKNYRVQANFDVSGILKSFHCDCEANIIWKGACKHTVCLLLKIHEQALEQEKNNLQDKAAIHIISAFENRLKSHVQKKAASAKGTMQLRPCLSTDERGKAFISLYISDSSSRRYVVKSIGEFLDNITNENYYSYGKELSLKHHMEAFDSESQGLIRFIDRCMDSCMDILKYTGNTSLGESGKQLPLMKRDLDEFFSLFESRIVDADIYGNNDNTLLLLDAYPPLDLEISLEHQKQTASISWPALSYTLIRGYASHYFVFSGTMYKIDKASSQAILSLLDEGEEENKRIFAGKKYQDFINLVLPVLVNMGIASPPENIKENYALGGLLPHLYFDINKKELLAKVVFCYGDYELPPASCNTLENDFPVIIRDAEGEYDIICRLTNWGFEHKQENIYAITNSDQAYRFLADGMESFSSAAEVFVTDTFKSKSLHYGENITFSAGIKGNFLELAADTGGYSLLELYEAVQAYNNKKKYFRFKDGSFMGLENTQFKGIADLINSLGIAKKDISEDKILAPKFRAFYLGDDGNRSIALNQDRELARLLKDIKDGQRPDFMPPKEIQNTLRQYQKTGFQWLKTLAHYGFGGVLADDMGLGKTIQVIALFLSEKGAGQPCLVVSPTSLMYNWEKEIKRFAPSLKAAVLYGTAEKRKDLFDQNLDVDVFITTYDMLKRDIDNYENHHFNIVVADEAQNIKNPATQSAKAIKLLHANIRLALTGTPIENALSELWSIFDFIMPGYLYSSAQFQKEYELPILREPDGPEATKLKKQISPFILRRVKKDVLTELPEKVETTVYAELSPEQKKLYTAHYLKAKGEFMELEQGDLLNRSRIDIIAQLTRLRQLCCHPSLFIEGYHGGSGKLDIAIEIITQAIENGHRVLLFSQFTAMLSLIKEKFEEENIRYFYLDGATPAKERTEMTHHFNNGEKDAFLISLKAGGTGLNLTGADVVVHFDQWWNPSVMNQASDRAHRFGQEKVVYVFNIVAKDTIEEKILELQDKKRYLSESLINTETGTFGKISEKELKELFSI